MTLQSAAAGAPLVPDQQKVLPTCQDVNAHRPYKKEGKIVRTGSAADIAALPLRERRHGAAVGVHERLVVAVRDLELDILVLTDVGRVGDLLVGTLGLVRDRE